MCWFWGALALPFVVILACCVYGLELQPFILVFSLCFWLSWGRPLLLEGAQVAPSPLGPGGAGPVPELASGWALQLGVWGGEGGVSSKSQPVAVAAMALAMMRGSERAQCHHGPRPCPPGCGVLLLAVLAPCAQNTWGYRQSWG